MSVQVLPLLEEKLREASEGLSDQVQRIKRVCQEDIWKEIRLPWYTDHGPDHSSRIVERLSELLEPLYAETNQFPLSPHELYILLAACYLHDIGMQNLSVDDEITRDEMGPEEYELVRSRHAYASYKLIISKTIGLVGRDDYRLPLEDDETLVPIALIAKAHAADDPGLILAELHKKTERLRLGGRDVRGRLLAHLLMVGDALDLSSKRARFPESEDARWPAVSILHNYRHHCIPGVRVVDGKNPHERLVQLWFEFPPEAEGGYALEIRDWVVNQLARQCRASDRVLRNELNLQWADIPVQSKLDYDKDGYRRLVPPEARPLLHVMWQRESLLNRDELKELLTTRLDQMEGGGFVIRAPQRFDLPEITDWLIAECKWRSNVKFACLDCAGAGLGMYRWDNLVSELSENLGVGDAIKKRLKELESRGLSWRLRRGEIVSYFHRLIERTGQERGRPVLLIENIQSLERDDALWLRDELLTPLLGDGKKALVIVTVENKGEAWEEAPSEWSDVTLEPYEKGQIVSYLRDVRALTTELAEMLGEMLFRATGGIPSAVLKGLTAPGLA